MKIARKNLVSVEFNVRSNLLFLSKSLALISEMSINENGT